MSIFVRKKLPWLIMTLTIALSLAAVAILYALRIIPHKTYDSAHFGIEPYVSDIDKDGDGVDDQTDILAGVRAYIATKPQYKSVYYGDTGWPNDEYGVCTDVVAQGLLAAGYDLMELMAEDMALHPERYDADAGDKMIAFRRVRNQLRYFEAHAVKLTNDIHEIDQWQGGDIVVFPGHVGIVSDRRNRKGIPYILHHGSPDQRFYEEDILESYDEVIGHYRIS